GFTGIMRPWHGIDMLLEAFRRLRADCAVPSHLLLVGDGPIRAEIEAGIRSAGLEGHVTITGRVSHLDIPAYVHAFDIAVSPKATFYASPMKILEYMAQGKPVVAPDMRNISDIIDDGVDGLLFRTNEAASLAEGLAKLAKDAELRLRIGAMARRKVEERLNWIQNAKTVLAWTENRSCAA
ncbi:MAG TPA: glycosyltransferase family 4 protein, partial [Fibrobacteria bacterium]|nr:glycosyltransferase family 4 protein [Fibrobacteria bacterium]